MTCPVALFTFAMTWFLRAGAKLLLRVGMAVIVAGTVFSAAIIIAEQAETFRHATSGPNDTILSIIVGEPVLASPQG